MQMRDRIRPPRNNSPSRNVINIHEERGPGAPSCFSLFSFFPLRAPTPSTGALAPSRGLPGDRRFGFSGEFSSSPFSDLAGLKNYGTDCRATINKPSLSLTLSSSPSAPVPVTGRSAGQVPGFDDTQPMFFIRQKCLSHSRETVGNRSDRFSGRDHIRESETNVDRYRNLGDISSRAGTDGEKEREKERESEAEMARERNQR